MVAARVEDPWLKGIVFRYLLAHAEDPSRAKGSGIPAVENFSRKAPFYDKFVKKVMEEVPGYDERKLLDTGADVPQEEFKAILRCFKELSGVWNPFHYSVFGRVIPAVQDKVTKMAAAVAGPSIVISSSSRYNDDFNSDQEIVIEKKPNTRRGITESTIQHYLLPSESEPYVEMITAGLGYWQGIPRLFKWRTLGETKILDLPFTIDELVSRDLAYAQLSYEENDGIIFINEKRVGRRVGLQELLEEEPIEYKEEFLTRELSSFELDKGSEIDGRPIVVDTPYEIGGEVLVPKGRYGMPCSRYVVHVPKANFARRFFWAGLSLFSRDKDEYLFLGKTNESIEASDEAHRVQLQIDRIHKAERDALEAARDVQRARADAAEADLARARAESEAREIAQELGNAKHLTEQAYNLGKGIGHDLRRESSRQMKDNTLTLEKMLGIVEKEFNYFPPYRLFEDNGDINLDLVLNLIKEESTPDFLKEVMKYVLRTQNRADIIHSTATTLMEKVIDSSKKVNLLYDNILGPIVTHLNAQPEYEGVDISYEPNSEVVLYFSEPLLKSALLNLITNAADVSLKGTGTGKRVFISANVQGEMSAITISQTGYLGRKKALELSTGQFVESTRDGGTGHGSQVTYSVIKASNGSIRYKSTRETVDASIRILLPSAKNK